jgi:hypothetical protein
MDVSEKVASRLDSARLSTSEELFVASTVAFYPDTNADGGNVAGKEFESEGFDLRGGRREQEQIGPCLVLKHLFGQVIGVAGKSFSDGGGERIVWVWIV